MSKKKVTNRVLKYVDKAKPTQELAPMLYRWLELFEACVRNKDYDTAKTIFHEKVIGSGKEGTSIGVDNLFENDFKKSWDEYHNFALDQDSAHIIPCDRTFIVLCPYVSKSRLLMGKDRKGAISATLRFFETKLLCLHIHTN